MSCFAVTCLCFVFHCFHIALIQSNSNVTLVQEGNFENTNISSDDLTELGYQSGRFCFQLCAGGEHPYLDCPAGGYSRNARQDYGGVHFRASHRIACLLYTSPSPRDGLLSRMPSSA